MARLSAGVEVSASGVRVALLSTKPVATVLKVAEYAIAPGEEGRIGRVLAKALDELGAKKADVHLTFAPPAPAASRHQLFVAPKKLKPAELSALAVRELRKDGSIDPAKMLFSVDKLGPGEGENAGDQHLLVALGRDEVEPVAAELLDAKKIVRTATTATMGLLRATTVSELPAEGLVAVALLEARRSSLFVLEGGVIRFFRDVPAPSTSGRDDEALVAQALARELDISLVYFAQQFRPKVVETLMICGDPAFADRVSDWMEESPKYRVVRFGTGPKLQAAQGLPENLAPYAVAIGAALGPKARAVPDVLPTELKGSPERAIATMVAVVLALVFMAVTLQLRRNHVERLEQETARLELARKQFAELEGKVNAAAKIDQQATQAQRWKELFEDHDAYHMRLAQLMFGLPAAIPARAKVGEVDLIDAPRPQYQPGQTPVPPGPDTPNLRLHLEGIVKAADLGGAQAELRSLVEATERLPSVKGSELSPIRAPSTDSGVLELPFTLDLPVVNHFPGPKR